MLGHDLYSVNPFVFIILIQSYIMTLSSKSLHDESYSSHHAFHIPTPIKYIRSHSGIWVGENEHTRPRYSSSLLYLAFKLIILEKTFMYFSL